MELDLPLVKLRDLRPYIVMNLGENWNADVMAVEESKSAIDVAATDLIDLVWMLQLILYSLLDHLAQEGILDLDV